MGVGLAGISASAEWMAVMEADDARQREKGVCALRLGHLPAVGVFNRWTDAEPGTVCREFSTRGLPVDSTTGSEESDGSKSLLCLGGGM